MNANNLKKLIKFKSPPTKRTTWKIRTPIPLNTKYSLSPALQIKAIKGKPRPLPLPNTNTNIPQRAITKIRMLQDRSREFHNKAILFPMQGENVFYMDIVWGFHWCYDDLWGVGSW